MVKSCGVGSAPASCTLMPNSTTNRLYCGPAVSTCRPSAVRRRQRQALLRSRWRHATACTWPQQAENTEAFTSR